MTAAGVIGRLKESLATLPADALATPGADRIGAVLVIVEPGGGNQARLVYTRRRDDMRSHPGQIAFPGGRVDAGETVEQAAVREAHEEVALDPAAVEVIGRLPAFYIPPSRFWLQAVVAHWLHPHDLVPAEAEVSAVLHVPLSRLKTPDTWRTVRLSTAGWSWAWDLGDGHLLWGATAVVTAILLGLLDPDWSGGALPADYRHREVRPWEGERRVVDRRLPARLVGVEERSADGFLAETGAEADATPARIAAAADVVARAAQELASDDGPIVILAGDGRTGDIGREAARCLAAAGIDVVTVDAAGFDGGLPGNPSVLIDALAGAGLRGGLKGAVLDLVYALRLRARPVISVDLPTGLHPIDGMVGEAVSADVTIAIGAIQPGLLLPGLAPFIGDLYVAPLRPDAPSLLRVVGATAAPTWRE